MTVTSIWMEGTGTHVSAPGEVEAGVVILRCLERTHSGAVVQRSVLKGFLFRELDDRDVDLDRVARALLFKELHQLRSPARCLDHDGHADVSKQPLNSSGFDLQPVDALEPHARAPRGVACPPLPPPTET